MGPTPIQLSSSNPRAATVSLTVTTQRGQVNATFKITAAALLKDTTKVSIRATLGRKTDEVSLTAISTRR